MSDDSEPISTFWYLFYLFCLEFYTHDTHAIVAHMEIVFIPDTLDVP